MGEEVTPVKAIALISGGLDSLLAALLMRSQGIEVTGVSFHSAFYQAPAESFRTTAAAIGKSIGVPIRVLDHTAELVDSLHGPYFGFGKHMNPCIDCRIRMLRAAAAIMKTEGARFAVTGEVLGQRPMSQHLQAMDWIDAAAGLEGYVLRPLSAKAMIPTVPELEGWVDREKLEGITGRTRARQFELAAELGLSDLPSPGGGCLLTHAEYSTKVRESLDAGDLDVRRAWLLALGRHFRLRSGAKLVVGRDEAENDALEAAAGQGDALLRPDTVPGPTAILLDSADRSDVECAAAICGRYMKLAPGAAARFTVRLRSSTDMVEVMPMDDETTRPMLVGVHRNASSGKGKRVQGKWKKG